MKCLFTKEEYDLGKASSLLKCKCYYCHQIFLSKKSLIKHELEYKRGRIKFCNQKCHMSYNHSKEKIKITCKLCFKDINRNKSELSQNNFCSKSCAAKYNNTHKTKGNRRSKLEIWLEKQLKIIYPTMNILFNDVSTIGLELDIYIPDLNVAFELNGIFHYEPIYGHDKLSKMQANDMSKSKSCHDLKIDLCVIDTTSQKYFKERTSRKFLDIIISIIEKRLLVI